MRTTITSLMIIITAAIIALGQSSAAPQNPRTEATTNTNVQQNDAFEAQLIPANSRVYIATFKSEDTQRPVEGFETYMAAALRKKNVPLIIVSDRSQADFEIAGSADKKGAGAAKKWLLGDFRKTTSASFTM